MVISVMLLIAAGVGFGILVERNRWVQADKKDKVIAVNGDLYKVIKTGTNAG